MLPRPDLLPVVRERDPAVDVHAASKAARNQQKEGEDDERRGFPNRILKTSYSSNMYNDG